MAGFSSYLEGKVLDHVFGNTAYSAPGTLYVGLYTTLPNNAGSGGTEVSGGSYARVAVTNNTTNWPNASGNDPATKSNGTSITFPAATANWGDVVGVGIFDASSGGNLLGLESFIVTPYVFTALASNDTLTIPGYTPSNGQTVRLLYAIGGTVPTGLAIETTYYIISSSGNTCQLSLTAGGAAINITADGSGLIASYTPKTISNGTTASYAVGALNIYLA